MTTDDTQDQPPAADDRLGTLGADADGHWQIRFERRLRHSPERVWEVLTDPGHQDKWVPGVRIEAVVGGAVLYDFDEQGKAEGEVLRVDPPRGLEHTWRWPGEPDSTVRWEISPDGAGALLVLMHRPLRRDPAVGYSTGWHVMVDALETHLDGGTIGEPDFAGLYEIYQQRI